METIRSLVTLAAFSSFLGIVWWAYAPEAPQGCHVAAAVPAEDCSTSVMPALAMRLA